MSLRRESALTLWHCLDALYRTNPSGTSLNDVVRAAGGSVTDSADVQLARRLVGAGYAAWRDPDRAQWATGRDQLVMTPLGVSRHRRGPGWLDHLAMLRARLGTPSEHGRCPTCGRPYRQGVADWARWIRGRCPTCGQPYRQGAAKTA